MLRVFENRGGVEENIWALEGRENGEWRKKHNEKINDLYSPKIIHIIKLRMRWAGNIAYMGESRGVYRVLFGNLEGKISLGRQHRYKWKDNIKIVLKVGMKGMKWTD